MSEEIVWSGDLYVHGGNSSWRGVAEVDITGRWYRYSPAATLEDLTYMVRNMPQKLAEGQLVQLITSHNWKLAVSGIQPELRVASGL